MKSNASCDGGYLLSQYYPDFANTMVLWLQDWKAAVGREANVESLQNEPNVSASYDSCTYTTDQINTVTTGYLKPAMKNANLTSLYTVPEPSVYGGTSYYDSNWAIPMLSNSAMDTDVDFMTTHGYGQLPNLAKPCATCQQYNKAIWQTEVMDSKGTYNNSITEGQKWSTSISQALNTGGFSAWYYWWVLYDNNNNGGLIKWDSTTTPWTFDIPKRVYTIGNFSRFMRPGSVLLTSSSSTSSLESTAAQPTSGTVALVLSNTSSGSITVTVSLSKLATPPASVTPFRTSATENQVQLSPIPVTGGSFTLTIPAGAIVTLVG